MKVVRGLVITVALSGSIYLIAFLCHESGITVNWGGEDVDVFYDGPTVCNGLLTFRGEFKGEAVVGRGDLSTFAVYRRSDLRPGYTGREVSPVLGFAEPPRAGYFYDSLPADMQVAERLVASPSSSAFELVSQVPFWIDENPSDYELSIWGFPSPTQQEEQVLFSSILKGCPES